MCYILWHSAFILWIVNACHNNFLLYWTTLLDISSACTVSLFIYLFWYLFLAKSVAMVKFSTCSCPYISSLHTPILSLSPSFSLKYSNILPPSLSEIIILPVAFTLIYLIILFYWFYWLYNCISGWCLLSRTLIHCSCPFP